MTESAGFDYEDLVPLQKLRRDELVNYLSAPEKVPPAGFCTADFSGLSTWSPAIPKRPGLLTGSTFSAPTGSTTPMSDYTPGKSSIRSPSPV